MRIDEIIKSGKVSVSCELFPPKVGSELSNTRQVVREMAALHPSYMSVTYGASGSNSRNSLEVAKEVESSGITALAHLTCIGQTEESLIEALETLKQSGIANVLALRGDMPPDIESPGVFKHASELIEKIVAFGGFCIGGACYPEGHPESPNRNADLDGVRRKVDAGCSFLTTQMFFDNNILYNYMFRLLNYGITVPVFAGVMPVTNAVQIKRICSLSNAVLPSRFKAIVDHFADNPAAMKQAGIAYATEQIIDLIANGVNHVHIYTMNRPDIAGSIMKNLSEIFL